jgi:restriction system protein
MMMRGVGRGIGRGIMGHDSDLFRRRRGTPEVLLLSEIVKREGTVSDGDVVVAVGTSWLAILSALQNDPNLLFSFSEHPRQFEEFIAAAYDRAGWDEVILTPRSGDRGRDVIAIKRGFGSVRFLDQTKAYSPGHLVSHDDIRAMLGVLQTDSNSSKGVITTTSDFQPTIRSSPEFEKFMPHRIELKNGIELLRWLREITDGNQK